MSNRSRQDLTSIADAIWHRAIQAGFKGYDPYDGLKSRILWPIVRRSWLLRLVVIQLVKRCPVNVRPLLLVEKRLNPKGLALFLSGASRCTELADISKWTQWLQDALLSLASLPDGSPALTADRTVESGIARRLQREGIPEDKAIGWGYDFPWQGRAFFLPAWFPTAVTTSFVLDSLDNINSPAYNQAAKASARLVESHLNRLEDADGICFSYSPRDTAYVYNASLFAAKILARGALAGGPYEWKELSTRAVDFVVTRQNEDGSWFYGEPDYWHWIDGHHTGFVLETLHDLSKMHRTKRWQQSIRKGLDFYHSRLIESDGTAVFATDRKFPHDPHTFAQAAITLDGLGSNYGSNGTTSKQILDKATDLLWDAKAKCFRMIKMGLFRDNAEYLRWSQAWMFKAICIHLRAANEQP
jgi:hypothetical protein